MLLFRGHRASRIAIDSVAGIPVLRVDAYRSALLHRQRTEADIYLLGYVPVDLGVLVVRIRVGIANVGQLESRRYRSEEHTSELQSLMRISYAVFCLKKKNI